jgi:Glycosyl transferase family 2
MELSPVLLFTYKRLPQTRQTISALQQNFLAEESELFIFSDGPKTEADLPQINSVRDYLRSVTGFKKITILESEKNKGLASSIIDGVTQMIDKYGQVIVLEDDLVTSKNFLSFCNQALQYYKNHSTVFSIGGYSLPMRGLNDNDTYFTSRSTSWGWATWKEQWAKVDWDVRDYKTFSQDRKLRRSFNRMGSDMATMLDKQMRGKINSWAIRWCYHQFRHQLVTVFPAVSKVSNIGFNASATHTKEKFSRFQTTLDQSGNTVFNFSDDLQLNKSVIAQFTRPYSIPMRIKYKLLNAFSR